MQLRRDLPLTVLIDLLLQILFVIAILFAIQLGSTERAIDTPTPSPEELLREIAILKAENAALKEENRELREENEELKKALEKERAKNAPKDKVADAAKGPGLPACLKRSPLDDPLAALEFRYVNSSTINAGQGRFYDQFSSATGFKLVPTKIDLEDLDQVFGVIKQYNDAQNCRFRAQLIVSDSITHGQSGPVLVKLRLYFRTNPVVVRSQ